MIGSGIRIQQNISNPLRSVSNHAAAYTPGTDLVLRCLDCPGRVVQDDRQLGADLTPPLHVVQQAAL